MNPCFIVQLTLAMKWNFGYMIASCSPGLRNGTPAICRAVEGRCTGGHDHSPVQGSMKVRQDGKWKSMKMSCQHAKIPRSDVAPTAKFRRMDSLRRAAASTPSSVVVQTTLDLRRGQTERAVIASPQSTVVVQMER